MSSFFQAYGLVQNLNGKLCLDTLQRLENKGIVNLGVWECQIEGSSSQVELLFLNREGAIEGNCLKGNCFPNTFLVSEIGTSPICLNFEIKKIFKGKVGKDQCLFLCGGRVTGISS
ncbi:unnamed protein product [Meloidogyne enterolobii]|uniref:Uncharacterized protein n=1 Tax=Meloidogyne enterolobii TaxID=390850 RepID=A0ACB1AN87_MELEN